MIDILRDHIHDQRIRLIDPHILHISSVHREDIGMSDGRESVFNQIPITTAAINPAPFSSLAGVYQCVIQSEHDEAQASAELKLGDVAPLLLETYQDKQIVESGSAITLRCAAIASPLPQIRWLLDDQPIPNLSRFRVGDHVTNDGKVVSFVNITNIRVVDGGEVIGGQSCL